MATLQTITARYQGLRDDDAARTAKEDLWPGKYYYVVIYRKLKYRYEFIGEFLEFDYRGFPIFAYESNINNKKCRWYCKPNDAIYELAGKKMPASLQDDIHILTCDKTKTSYRCLCL
jgi:hypothetical protein